MNKTFSYKSFKMLMFVFPIGMFIFGMMSFFLLKNGFTTGNSSLLSTFQFWVPVAIVVGIFSSAILGNRKLRSIREKKTMEEKLASFQSLSIIKMALLEIPALVAILAALFTGEIQFLFIAMAVIIVMVIGIPAKSKIVEWLDFSATEAKEFIQNN